MSRNTISSESDFARIEKLDAQSITTNNLMSTGAAIVDELDAQNITTFDLTSDGTIAAAGLTTSGTVRFGSTGTSFSRQARGSVAVPATAGPAGATAVVTHNLGVIPSFVLATISTNGFPDGISATCNGRTATTASFRIYSVSTPATGWGGVIDLMWSVSV